MAAKTASHHPDGLDSVLGLDDRGRAVAGMANALTRWLSARTDIGAALGLGGSGNTALVTQAMRALPVGVPKLMISTVASGNVAPYVGPSDIALMCSVADVAGLNAISRRVIANAAPAVAGMALNEPPAAPASEKPGVGLTMFGVTTALVTAVREALEPDYECYVFHATGAGGQSMEKLADSGLLAALLDLTTTEVADHLVGGVFPRLGRLPRLGHQRGVAPGRRSHARRRGAVMTHAAGLRVGAALFLGAAIAAWALVTHLGFVSSVFLPTPLDTARSLVDGLRDGDLGIQLSATLVRMVLGWLLASLVGVVIGTIIGLSAWARAAFLPTLEFLRPLPASAIIPLAIALLGLGPGMALAVVVVGSVWPTLLATVQGFRSVPVQLRELARCLEMSSLSFAWKIGLRNALPDILGGMRLSLTVSLILSITCEMISGEDGLGTAVLPAARSFRADELIASVVLLGAIGFVSNLLIEALARRMLAWQSSG